MARTHHDWVELQLNIGRKRARREAKKCRPVEYGPAYVHYKVGTVDVIFVDHDDGNGVGRLTGADLFHQDVPLQLYGELEIEAKIIMRCIRDHIRESKRRRQMARAEIDPLQLRLKLD